MPGVGGTPRSTSRSASLSAVIDVNDICQGSSAALQLLARSSARSIGSFFGTRPPFPMGNREHPRFEAGEQRFAEPRPLVVVCDAI